MVQLSCTYEGCGHSVCRLTHKFSVLLSKLPQELRLILSRELRSDNWELDRIMKLLETEVQARERASGNTAMPQAHKNPPPPPKSPLTATAAALVAGSADVKPTLLLLQSVTLSQCMWCSDFDRNTKTHSSGEW